MHPRRCLTLGLARFYVLVECIPDVAERSGDSGVDQRLRSDVY